MDENGEPIQTAPAEATATEMNTTVGKKNKYAQFSIEELKNFLAENKDEIGPGKYKRIV